MQTETERLALKVLARDKRALRSLAKAEGEAMSVVVRRLIREMAAGKSFLNLFCYTGAASIHAALGGADKTLSIDLSNT